MKAEIKVPAVGESVSEATIGEWAKKSGEFVKRDDVILMLETDKASVEVVAPNDGVLVTQANAGDVVKIGAVVAYIDTAGTATAGMPAPAQKAEAPKSQAPTAPPPAGASKQIAPELQQHLSPAVRRVVEEKGIDPASVKGTGKDGRLVKSDVEAPQTTGQPTGQPAAQTSGAGAVSAGAPAAAPMAKKGGELPPLPVARGGGQTGERVKRVAMSTIRKRIAERLVSAQHNAAILTTFNEVDMTQVLELREKYKDRYKEKYGVSLGFMGFFVKAVIEGLKEIPGVNASIEGTDILYKNYYNIGVAIGTEKGLMVPVIKDADRLSIAEIELAIKHYAVKARDGKISVDDFADGTFTISNGGVYGSLMSTPILNPPQSGILGMHKIEERPMVVNKQIVVRPMMYIAMSYDHRMIDGKEAVTFLVKVKECIEDPTRILLEV